MPAYNAVKALERTYRIIMTRYFEEASSVNFCHSVVYGFAMLWMLVKFIAHKWKGSKGATVQQAVAQYHQSLSPYETVS